MLITCLLYNQLAGGGGGGDDDDDDDDDDYTNVGQVGRLNCDEKKWSVRFIVSSSQ